MGNVLLSFLRDPMTFPDGRKVFVLELRDDTGQEHQLISLTQPAIFNAEGEPVALLSELGAGSRISVHSDGRVARAVQVIDHVSSNPFRTIGA